MAAGAISFDLKEIEAVKNMLANAALNAADRAKLLHGIGVEIEEQTKERFETKKTPEGNTWKALAQKTREYYAGKGLLGHRSILVGEGTLRDSLTSEVRDGAWSALAGATMEYAAIHQWGGEIKPKSAKALFVPGYGMLQKVTMPPRPYLGVSMENVKGIEDVVAVFLEGILK
ncbi:MAG: phage virion morphogenesis protein [Treponema sp.]|jgi:phage virion morphogenesis protein|nr:phage virion morphogenesis protein [Treponema sp.]